MAAGDRLPALERLRDLLDKRLKGDVDGRSTAGLARQYRETLREIEDLKRARGAAKKGSLVDELAKRRQTQRRAGSTRRAAGRRGSSQSGS